MQPLRAMHVERKGPVAPRKHSCLFNQGDQISVFSDASTSLLRSGKLGGLSNSMPLLPKRRRLIPAARAFNSARYGFHHIKSFEGTQRPKWWWRTLSCIPYLFVLHKARTHAGHLYLMHPFLADFGFLIDLANIVRIPQWVLIAYDNIAYLGVVRRKDQWPYFLRFNVILGMLLDASLEIFMIGISWMPLAAFWGKPGMVLWMAINSVYVLTVLECLRNAVAGTYADISFLTETAYIQTKLK